MKYYLCAMLFSAISVGIDYIVIRLFSHSGPFVYIAGALIIGSTLMMNKAILAHFFPEHYIFEDDEHNKKTDKDDKSVSP